MLLNCFCTLFLNSGAQGWPHDDTRAVICWCCCYAAAAEVMPLLIGMLLLGRAATAMLLLCYIGVLRPEAKTEMAAEISKH